jgi:CheY-like chemotaxis protein
MPYKLLLADDSVTIQRVIELTFADEDIKVTAVGDGQQAVDRILADRPHIVLADVGMPRRDGYEVAAFIKDNPELAHIPVLLLTGAFEPVDEERARAARCNGVLAKPFEPQLLIARVKELLGGVAPSAPAEHEAPVESAMAALDASELGGAAASPADALAAAPPAPPAPSAPSWEDDATVRLPRFAGTTISDDLKLDTASLVERPAAPAAPDGSLDDYFDRLDAAFAHLTGNAGQREHGSDAGAIVPGERADSGGPRSAWQEAPGSRPEPEPVPPAMHFDRNASIRPDVSGPEPPMGATSAPSDDLEAASSRLSVPVSDAFASLLDGERHLGPGVAAASVPAGGVLLPGTLVTDKFVADVARRVLDLVGEPAFRDVVADVVSRTAERLVRAEIERIKASVK